MIVSWAIDVGGALPVSARNALHASSFDVARIRAEPFAMEGLTRSTQRAEKWRRTARRALVA